MGIDRVIRCLWRVFLAAFVLQAGVTAAMGQTLESDLPSGQPVGTTVTWSVTGAGGTSDYRLQIARANEPLQIRYGYSDKRIFTWTPLETGQYRIVASVRSKADPSQVIMLQSNFTIQSRASNGPRLSVTNNPLVALYSAPACAAGNTMEVRFLRVGDTRLFETDRKACNGARSMNFYVGGMRAEATYQIRHLVRDGTEAVVDVGPTRSFTTGTPTRPLPITSVRVPPGPQASQADPILVSGPTPGNGGVPFAVDMEAEHVWYYDNPLNEADWFMVRMVPGGSFLMMGPVEGRYRLREIDMAGNAIREKIIEEMTQQYFPLGGGSPLVRTHHDARYLPDGNLLLLADSERLYEDVQGPGIVDILGDIVLVLDQDWQVIWQWTSYDKMDLTREATLGEICVPGGPGCPILYLAEEANDWLHSNSVSYSPADGNLIISMRHQDWVVKIDYRDGAGSGDVIWRLGPDGDFTPISTDPFPWNTHQHDANYLGDDLITIYDNAVAHPDCLADPAQCESRGLVYRLDEVNMTAETVVNAWLGGYAIGVGSAQQVLNGNYSFGSGGRDAGPRSTADEVTVDGDIVFSIAIDEIGIYRSFRVRNLYTPPERGF